MVDSSKVHDNNLSNDFNDTRPSTTMQLKLQQNLHSSSTILQNRTLQDGIKPAFTSSTGLLQLMHDKQGADSQV